MAPHAGSLTHLALPCRNLDSREAVDEAAQRGRTAGCLAWEPAELSPPVGYIRALADPDGNLVEFSFGQDAAAVVENPPE
ncbi:MAG: hypothetical protein QF796_02730 [Acidimicrobiales bacterium]|jgi:predicted lactoylglutathione lyase|nr:hypothetical protein [Acidimicrobiaceae bacterium]MDP6492534.1 hypothetical protein [Acidimicrobiales bacterium]MDP6649037.1 hypothetical protein [Acidimicrobiales bacterium]MDP6760283.1 hypothetical protein [Acidimicrobiales bacterium]|tara:strand:+ start:5700 stop:5939 length:240 start_codon:yes stop_codon:yes gene_type:complete